MTEQENDTKSCVPLDSVSGKSMICLLCLFRAAGSMPVACVPLGTGGRRVAGSVYVCRENSSPPQQPSARPDARDGRLLFSIPHPRWQEPTTHSAPPPSPPQPRWPPVQVEQGPAVRTVTPAWDSPYYDNIVGPVLGVSSDHPLLRL